MRDHGNYLLNHFGSFQLITPVAAQNLMAQWALLSLETLLRATDSFYLTA